MLAEREPVPRRVDGNRAPCRVLAEVPQEVAFERRRVAADLREARREVVGSVPTPAERVVRAMEAELLVPRAGEELLLELGPAVDADLLHARRLSADRPELHSRDGAGARSYTWIRASARAAPAPDRLGRRRRARGAGRVAGQALDQARGEGVCARARDPDDRPDDARGAGHAGQGRGARVESDPAGPDPRRHSVGRGGLRVPESRADSRRAGP